MPAKVTILGRLTRDPEIKETPKTTMTTFSIASNSGYGENKTTSYFDCVCFGRRGEALSKHAGKGKELMINGDLTTRTYNGRDGTEKMSLNVKVDDWNFTADGGAQKQQEPQRQVSTSVADEMPF